jgi:hypothetical protein
MGLGGNHGLVDVAVFSTGVIVRPDHRKELGDVDFYDMATKRQILSTWNA